jgi:hypothetical protein
MLEAENGESVLDDVSEDTFIRLCQFAYTGDYETPSFVLAPIRGSSGTESTATSPVPAAIESAEGQPVDEEIAERGEDVWTFNPRKRKEERPKTPTLRQEFDKRVYSIELVDAVHSVLKILHIY